ncbi:MAG TPA: TIGR03564 family F420-dependent LLM class oxidoreductase [Acidimicrobiales bacterium]|nr:TIGR03564 family F420-dependent LLM class oxidoreductase [Acidimicrobiales bacterium]
MRIGVGLDTDGPLERTLERARMLSDLGFSSMWSSQIFGPDTLTVLAIVGRELAHLDLGTAVVPVQPRHPSMLAAQARTVQEAIGGRLTLGIGLSHQVIVEGLWGISFDRPASYMREYVEALAPMLAGEPVATAGEQVRAVATGPVGPKDVDAPSLVVAALGPKMLRLAGTMTDGTILWMTGRRTIATHVVPTITAAAAAAGRSAPRVVCSLPVTVSDDAEGARRRINEVFAVYATLPSYAAMLKKEGATQPADVSLVGSRGEVLEQLGLLAEAGVTEFSGAVTGSPDEREATFSTLLEFASQHA